MLSVEQIRAHRLLSSGLDRSATSAEALPLWGLAILSLAVLKFHKRLD